MRPRLGRPRMRQAGYALVALMVSVTVMTVMMAAAMPFWRYLVKDDREEELIFRGGEIADAIARYQKKNGSALPPSLDVLVKGKFLRKAYKDPMSKDGKWRFLRQGEALAATASPVALGGGMGALGGGLRPGRLERAERPDRPERDKMAGGSMGAILGVASTSTDKSLRIFNGRTKYNEWLFIPGQPRNVGLQAGPTTISPGKSPGGRPSPAIAPRSR